MSDETKNEIIKSTLEVSYLPNLDFKKNKKYTKESLSDITLSKGNELDFTTYVEIASKRSALWCKKFIEKLYAN